MRWNVMQKYEQLQVTPSATLISHDHRVFLGHIRLKGHQKMPVLAPECITMPLPQYFFSWSAGKI